MQKNTIGVGTIANDGTGDPLRTGGQKVNTNFAEIYPYQQIKSADYTLVITDESIRINASAGNVDITLPTITSTFDSKIYTITASNLSNTSRVLTSGTDTISNGDAIFTFYNLTDVLRVQADSTSGEWVLLQPPRISGSIRTVGTSGYYADVKTAYDDGSYNLIFVSDVTESADIDINGKTVLIYGQNYTWTCNGRITTGSDINLKLNDLTLITTRVGAFNSGLLSGTGDIFFNNVALDLRTATAAIFFTNQGATLNFYIDNFTYLMSSFSSYFSIIKGHCKKATITGNSTALGYIIMRGDSTSKFVLDNVEFIGTFPASYSISQYNFSFTDGWEFYNCNNNSGDVIVIDNASKYVGCSDLHNEVVSKIPYVNDCDTINIYVSGGNKIVNKIVNSTSIGLYSAGSVSSTFLSKLEVINTDLLLGSSAVTRTFSGGLKIIGGSVDGSGWTDTDYVKNSCELTNVKILVDLSLIEDGSILDNCVSDGNITVSGDNTTITNTKVGSVSAGTKTITINATADKTTLNSNRTEATIVNNGTNTIGTTGTFQNILI